MTATRRDVKELADRLIESLDTLMPSEQADAIVADVASSLYNDVLGIKGKVVVDPTAPISIIHGRFGPNGEKSTIAAVKFRFEAKKR
jgi:hypothetical protein